MYNDPEKERIDDPGAACCCLSIAMLAGTAVITIAALIIHGIGALVRLF